MVDGVDVSHFQDPAKFDWWGLKARGVRFVVARAIYGKGTADRDFKKFADAVRENGLVFGAYLFYRQVHSVRDQLLLWQRQLDLIGGLQPGDLYPVLDMEENARNGDGRPVAAQFSGDCQRIAQAMHAEYGGVVLYYSSYFPEYLGTRTRPGLTLWMKQVNHFHWLADYGAKTKASIPGKPRTPYTPQWHVHQYAGDHPPGRIPEYAGGGENVDLNVLNPAIELDDLRIRHVIEVSDEAREGEEGTTNRPGGCDFEG